MKKFIKVMLYFLLPQIIVSIISILLSPIVDFSSLNNLNQIESIILLLLTPLSFLGVYFITFKESKDLKFKISFKELVDVLKIVALALISNVFIQFVLFKNLAEQQTVLNIASPINPIISVFIVGIFVPFCEELFFRKGFDKLIENKTIYYIVNILLFTIMHFDINIPIKANLPILSFISIFAFMLSYFYKKHDNIYVPIMAHSLMNTLGILVTILGG